LQQPEIVEGPLNVGIGGPDQFGKFDFGSLREDLQANGVEGDGHQRAGKEDSEQHDDQFAEAEQGIEAFDPGRVELDVRNLWPGGKGLGQTFERFRLRLGGVTTKASGSGFRGRLAMISAIPSEACRR
jgi:hypothetical protein